MKSIKLFLSLFLIVVSVSFIVVSCTKKDVTENTEDIQVKSDNINSENYDIEIDDSEKEEPIELQTRGANSITSITCSNTGPTKNKRYTASVYPLAWPGLTATVNTSYLTTLTGTFDTTSPVTATIRNVPITILVKSRTLTEIKVVNPYLPALTKSGSIKYVVGDAKSYERFVTASYSFGEEWNVISAEENAVFPSAIWEVSQQSKRSGPAYYYGDPIAITSGYIPQQGDLLQRSGSFGDAQKAIVMSNATDADLKGFRSVLVWERNRKGKGNLEKKKYKYKDGVFTPRVAETAFSHKILKVSL